MRLLGAWPQQCDPDESHIPRQFPKLRQKSKCHRPPKRLWGTYIKQKIPNPARLWLEWIFQKPHPKTSIISENPLKYTLTNKNKRRCQIKKEDDTGPGHELSIGSRFGLCYIDEDGCTKPLSSDWKQKAPRRNGQSCGDDIERISEVATYEILLGERVPEAAGGI